MLMRFRYIYILLFLTTVSLSAREYADSAIYQGINLKLDLATPVLELARYKGKVASCEMAMNVQLQDRFYPTLEFGYGQADCTAAGGSFSGKGGFGRIGLDLSALKKNRKENILLVGLRLGTAVQGASLTDVRIWDTYWQQNTVRDFEHTIMTDVWGEVVGGVQVKVYKSFHMGWFVRLKILFTRNDNGEPKAYYIPGFGFRQDTNFGINYYLGWKF